MGLVVLTTVLPAGRRGGGEAVTQSIVDALSGAGEDVRVVGYLRAAADARPATAEMPAGERPIETSAAGPRAVAWLARALVTRAPYSSAKFASRAYVRTARQALADGPSALIADHAQVHFAVRRTSATADGTPLVFVAHNAEAEVYDRLAAAARGPARRWVMAREGRRVGRLERDLAGRAQQVWTLTEADADYFRGLCPGADVRAIDVASALPPAPVSVEPEYDVALIGSWSWQANALGLEWFADQVVPQLSRDLSVEVAGAGAGALEGRYANVAVRGFVPDAQEFLSRARVIAVPAVTGGGVQVKTLDAISSGSPVVTTAVGSRGLGALPASVAVEDDPADFAAAVARLAADADRDRLRAEAVEWSRARRERFDRAIASWIAELTGGGGAWER